MGRPSQADLLAYQLSSSTTSLPSASSLASAKKKTSFQARSAIRNHQESDSDDDDDEVIGYGKPQKRRPKESLLDLLNSEPPPSWVDGPTDNTPPPTPSVPKKKTSFGARLLRGRQSKEPAVIYEDDAAFRQSGPLRASPSSTSLGSRSGKGSKLGRLTGDDAGEFMPKPFMSASIKLTPKDAFASSDSTRDLADFLRSSQPPSLVRSPSVANSIDTLSTTTTTHGRLRSVLNGRTKSDDSPVHRLENERPRPESKFGLNIWASDTWASGQDHTENMGSPLAESRERRLKLSMSSPSVASSSPATSPTLSRSATAHSVSSTKNSDGSMPSPVRRMSRKPVPAALDNADETTSSILPFMSQSTLAMLLGEDSEVLNSPKPASHGLKRRDSQTREAAVIDALKAHSTRSEPISSNGPPRAPERAERPQRSSSKNRDLNVPSSRSEIPAEEITTNVFTTPPIAISPSHDRPTSPPPDGPIPQPPAGRSRPRPVSIAIQPTRPVSGTLNDMLKDARRLSHVSQSPVSNASAESFVDPQVSTPLMEMFSSTDPIFLALVALQQSMRQAASLRLDGQPFPTLDPVEAAAAPLTNIQLAAILPSLRALQTHMSSAVSLLDIIVRRAGIAAAAEAEPDAEHEAAMADFLLGGEPQSSSASVSMTVTDSGIGLMDDEGGKERGGRSRETSGSEDDDGAGKERFVDVEQSDEDAFPLLVRHLSISE